MSGLFSICGRTLRAYFFSAHGPISLGLMFESLSRGLANRRKREWGDGRGPGALKRVGNIIKFIHYAFLVVAININ